ncbi:Haloacid dehalogenase domain protein hydrolase [Cellulomonas flavigena DSM 20109]|uniref:Haloacid dehalogenase domain protein hydrolase n=1 Tax=Cellulomonas flavigena (strain ATCC 482 / DSM 20109 / BCRC 11376 / JCM 18109 / NBRC 3775 / NCIMB 8073 / NRS 134) TaxID=446466 RepID=D5UD13_CELFN|nr:HAD hydrolase-like protein [Cellulomonas flavigena]ADG74350.1 Haloacid dehalogenase domain protein hydrolase [Cellulomonas flavigena DSM 20109]
MTGPAPLVLLDLDGTLTDSYPGIAASARVAFGTLGLPVPDAAALRRFVGPPLVESFALFGVAPERVPDAVAAYRGYFRETGMWENTVYPGIPDQLAVLRDAGVRLAVATSKPEVFAGPICEQFGLAPFVEGVFGAPLDHVPSTKATVVGAALDALRPAGQVLMVGDREHDAHGARAHGVDCLGVAWGYAQPGELTAAGVVGVVAEVADLAAGVLAALSAAAAPGAAPTTGR